jgi:CheY-like chemotaxis protein
MINLEVIKQHFKTLKVLNRCKVATDG